MKAVQIFMHSLRQVTGNLQGALRVSAVPYGLQFAASLLLLGSVAMPGQSGPEHMTPFEGGSFVLFSLINLIATLVTGIWAAIGWHRFVLKGELPSGFIPPFNTDRSWAYFARSFGIGLLCILLAIPLGALAGIVAFPFMDESGPGMLGLGVIFLITYAPLTVISYRLSTALPATALDAPSAFRAGWDATRGELSTFIWLALFSVLGFFGLSMLGTLLFGGVTILALIWQLVFGWFILMFGLSILTTLYGHYIERRPLV